MMARGEGKWDNSVNWKRGHRNNRGRGGQGKGKRVNSVNIREGISTTEAEVAKGKVNR